MTMLDWLVVGCLVATLFLIASQVVMGRKIKELEYMVELLAIHATVQAELVLREALERLEENPYNKGKNSGH